MNKWKKVVGNVMVASMILTNTSAISVAAKETEAEKQYVILAENDAYEIMGSELPEDAEKETYSLKPEYCRQYSASHRSHL